jgi:hypothetical protein
MSAELPRVERAEDGYFLWFHACVDPEFDDIGAKLPVGPNGWQWTEDGGLTPSIWCHGCDTHGFWDGPTKGWRPA